jgi:uncharacterized cupredoxin-like copper-binding protein
MRIHKRVLIAVAAAALTLSAAGCGGDKSTNSTGRGASRTIEVTMSDNAYEPKQLQVTKGETVTLRFRNAGAVKHEAILGDHAAQMRHHDEMTASTGQMDHGGGHRAATTDTSSDAITVEPGRTGELTHTFTEPGSIFIGCHEPGHWEDGMKATVTVT